MSEARIKQQNSEQSHESASFLTGGGLKEKHKDNMTFRYSVV